MADDEPWAKRIGINGVALAMGGQALLLMRVKSLLVAGYGVAAVVVILEDLAMDPGALRFMLGGVTAGLCFAAFMIVALTAPDFATAWGLRGRKPWSRLAGLIFRDCRRRNSLWHDCWRDKICCPARQRYFR